MTFIQDSVYPHNSKSKQSRETVPFRRVSEASTFYLFATLKRFMELGILILCQYFPTFAIIQHSAKVKNAETSVAF